MSTKKKKDKKSDGTNDASPQKPSIKDLVVTGDYAVRVSRSRITAPDGQVCTAVLSPSCLRSIETRVSGIVLLRNKATGKQRIARVWISSELSTDEVSLDDTLREALGITNDGTAIGVSNVPVPHPIATAVQVQLTLSSAVASPLVPALTRFVELSLRVHLSSRSCFSSYFLLECGVEQASVHECERCERKAIHAIESQKNCQSVMHCFDSFCLFHQGITQ
eukprot:c1092_g1_i1.p1 GENE.c1092_g1_i1~~c1092_g1_i1.p1  ORF type:complete len:235 (-),score=50.37 c1092_g1_i1:100-762(-)